MTTEVLERRIGYVLKTGNLISTVLLATGVIVVLTAPGAAAGPILIQAGLLIVIATPIVRVLVSLIGFVQAREWKFVVMTVAVLGVVGASVVVAFN